MSTESPPFLIVSRARNLPRQYVVNLMPICITLKCFSELETAKRYALKTVKSGRIEKIASKYEST